MTQRRSRVLGITVAACLFGLLMGLRDQFIHTWERTLVAAAAGGVMGVILVLSQHRK